MAEDWGRRQREARESWLPLDGYEVRMRCPDLIDIRRMERAGADIDESCVLQLVVDWRGVTEAMLAPGVGGEEPVKFTPGAWREWVGGRPDDFDAIASAFADQVRARYARRESIEGKSTSS